MKKIAFVLCLGLSAAAWAKLPALSDEAKAKAAEASAKSAWAGKVDAYQLCKAQDRVAAHVARGGKAAGKDNKAAASGCTDPGPFVYTQPGAAAPAAASAAPAAAPAKKS